MFVPRVWKNVENSVELVFEKKSDWKVALEANKWQIEVLKSRACKFLSKNCGKIQKGSFCFIFRRKG